MKKIILTLAVMAACLVANAQQHYELVSPDGSLKTEVEIKDGKITYNLAKAGSLVLAPSEVAMNLAGGAAYDGAVKFRKAIRTSVDALIESPFYKKSQVEDNYNQLSLSFKTFDLVFRAYDAGVAYRFVSKSKVPFKVISETAQFAFPADWNMYVPYVCQNTQTLESQYFNSFENRYEHIALSAWSKDRLAFLPLMVESPDG